MCIVVRDLSQVVRANHENLYLFFSGNIESLVVDALDLTIDDCISLPLCPNTRLYSSMFFRLILSPPITTLRGPPFAALCTMCFVSTRHYNLGLSPTNEVRRWPLCSSIIICPVTSHKSWGWMRAEGICFCLIPASSRSRVVLRSNLCHRVPKNRRLVNLAHLVNDVVLVP